MTEIVLSRKINTQDEIPPYLGIRSSADTVSTLLFAIAVLSLLEISWVSALILVCTIATMAIFGRLVMSATFNRDLGFGVNFVAGSGVVVLLTQMLLLAGFNHRLAHLVPLTFAAASLFFLQRIASSGTSPLITPNRPISVSFELLIGLVVLSMFHFWLVPFSAAVILVKSIDRRIRDNLLTRTLLTPVVVVGWLISYKIRPERWWYFYQGNDSQFFESISYSIARWGVLEHPGFIGGSIAEYHWFSYGLFGSLSVLALLAPWEALMKVAPILLPILFASLFVSQFPKAPKVLTTGWFAIVLGTAAMELGRTTSLIFSMVVAFAMTSVALEMSVTKSRYTFLSFFLLSIVLFLSKVTTGVIIGAMLVVSAVLQLGKRENPTLVPLAALCSAFVPLYLFLFRNNDSEQLLGFALNVKASLNELLDLLEPQMLLNAIAGLVAVAMTLGTKKRRDFNTYTVAIGLVAIVGLLAHVVLAGKTTRYFGLPGVWVLTLVAVWTIGQSLAKRTGPQSSPRKGRLMVLALGSSAIGYTSPRIIRKIDAWLHIEGPIEEYIWAIAKSSGFLMAVVGALFVSLLFRRRQAFALMAMAVAIGTFAGQRAENYAMLAYWGPSIYESSQASSAVFAKSDLVAVSEYVRKSTDDSVVLASNFFCCFGENWIVSGHSEREFQHISVMDKLTEARWGGASYLLPAYTRRRFLLQGLRFQLGYSSPSHEQVRRMAISLEFANRPSWAVLEKLRSYGVSGFIADTSLTEQKNWSVFAQERFRDGNFVYLELKSPPVQNEST